MRALYVIAGLVVLVFLFGLYHVRTETNATRKEIARLTAEIDKQNEQIRLLENSLNKLEVPGRVGQIARDRLQMQPPTQGRILVQELSASELVQATQAPTRAPANGVTTATSNQAIR